MRSDTLAYMKISLNWLGDFVEWSLDPSDSSAEAGRARDDNFAEVIADRITGCVGEVEAIEVQGAQLEHCCVGKVQTIRKHPNADTLSLCDVQTDRGVKRVVCGGTNLREGMRVAFAHVGARVKWHGEAMQTLAPVKIRGEESEGMICAAEELGLEGIVKATATQGKRPIVDLGPSFAKATEGRDGADGIGRPLREYLGLDDVIFHVDNHAITHRADLFSQIGFARECVAVGLARWKKIPTYHSPRFGKTQPPACYVDIPKLVPRYLACLLEVDSLGETPDWMKRRLASTGYRPVSLPVDITNYVAAEVGMPLHSFDFDDIRGTVHFRTSKAGEVIVTLDEVERKLPEGAIVLSDDVGIFDLMGVMGGLRSSTKESTRRIYLHSAVVDPVSIRKTIITTGHRTDAATVYEKNIPRVVAQQGLFRALQLFLELVPGARIVSQLEEWGDNGKAKPIPFSLSRVHQMLGADVSMKDVKRILIDLEFRVKTAKGGKMAATPPLHRLGDIRGEHDLIEEIGRIYGYDAVPDTTPSAPTVPPVRETRIHAIRDALKEQGAFELVPLSLLSPDLLRKCRMGEKGVTALANPIGEELSLMQPTVLPRLLGHAEGNLLHVEDVLRTFSVANVFRGGEEWTEMAVLTTQKRPTEISADPFLLVKQYLTVALADAGYELVVSLAKDPPPFAHAGRCAELQVEGKSVGEIFEIHPTVRANFDLPGRASACVLNLTTLLTLRPRERIAISLPAYPAVVYDATATFSPVVSVRSLISKARRISPLLESIDIVDLFSGKSLPEGKYNVTFRCTYRAKDRTLTEEEAKEAHTKVEKAVSKTS